MPGIPAVAVAIGDAMAFAGLFGGVFERSAERYGTGAHQPIRYADEVPVTSVKDHPHIHTPEFKAWFGDWTKRKPGEHSHVVHPETGKPLIAYHGTRHDFQELDDRDTFLASHQDDAEIHGHNIMPAFLNFRNPLVVRTDYDPTDWLDGTDHDDIKKAKMLGNDGLIVNGKDGRSTYVAFHPHQIKSATGNRGTYDPKDPRIHYNDDVPVLFGGLFDGVFRSF